MKTSLILTFLLAVSPGVLLAGNSQVVTRRASLPQAPPPSGHQFTIARELWPGTVRIKTYPSGLTTVIRQQPGTKTATVSSYSR
jgi:hypothetical protein